MLHSGSVLLACLSAVAFFGAPGGADAAGGDDRDTVVAAVDGTRITLADFERQRPLALFQARNSYYEAEKKAVDAYMDDYLLERQAQKENVTVAKLLEIHVNSQIAKDPSEESLKVYYEGLDTKESFETMGPKIRDHVRELRIGRAKAAYIQSLRQEARIVMNLAPPRAPVAVGDAPLRGTAGAPLTLVEYADYECPYCQQIAPDLSKIEAEYKTKLAFVYKDFPLPMHPRAQKASEAAHCAGNQNKYWEFHDLMLTSKQLDVPQLKAGAKTLGLDTKAFDKCLDSGERAQAVKANLDEAMQLGISGTPSFFLNGRFISGTLSYDQLRQILDEELKSSSAPSQQAANR